MSDVVAVYRKLLGTRELEADNREPLQELHLPRNDLPQSHQGHADASHEQTFKGKTRVLLMHRSAAEVAELDRLAREAMAKRKAARPTRTQRPEKLVVTIPAGAQKVEASKDQITFTVALGQAKRVVENLVNTLKQQGWKAQVGVLEEMAGVSSLSRGDQRLTIAYHDTGVLPADVTIDAKGIELERAKDTK